jgi:hypothetical protein
LESGGQVSLSIGSDKWDDFSMFQGVMVDISQMTRFGFLRQSNSLHRAELNAFRESNQLGLKMDRY